MALHVLVWVRGRCGSHCLAAAQLDLDSESLACLLRV